MNEHIKRTVVNGFADAIDDLIAEDQRVNRVEWDNNPLHPIAIITSAIGVAESTYKEMLKNHHQEFDIEFNLVDNFINNLVKQAHNKYFE
jgi:hypothetical protein